MIPRIGNRGHSFKGAAQYFLHDKKAKTKDRVAWTHTHNVPTQDPELAMKWMAHTAINRDRIKQEAGVSAVGRKGTNKPVYHFSLGWQPEQNPQKEHMLELAFDALEMLGLKDHEAVIVAHNDTEHPHVHIITNLVNPQNGKTTRPQNDRLRFSTWAEAYEKEHGKIYCEERVINNERRRGGEKVKHREVKVDQSLIIQNLYNQSDSSKAFQAALEQEGLTLAKGDRRGFVLVDEQGKIISLSRQLKGQRAKDIRERLGNLKDLPHAQTLSDERQGFDRDKYETERPENIIDSAREAEENRKEDEQKVSQDRKKEATQKGESKKLDNDKDYQDRLDKLKSKADKMKGEPQPQRSFADELDKKRSMELKADQTQVRKEKEMRAFYNRSEHQEKINELQKDLEKKLGKAEKQRLQSELKSLQKTLTDIDNRMREQGIDSVDPTTRDYSKEREKENLPKQELSPDEIKQKKREELRKQMNPRNKDRGNDFDLDR